MSKRDERKPDLSQWYKPTREGAAARRYLITNQDPIQDETGAVGEDVNVKSKENKGKKGKSPDETSSKG